MGKKPRNELPKRPQRKQSKGQSAPKSLDSWERQRLRRATEKSGRSGGKFNKDKSGDSPAKGGKGGGKGLKRKREGPSGGSGFKGAASFAKMSKSANTNSSNNTHDKPANASAPKKQKKTLTAEQVRKMREDKKKKAQEKRSRDGLKINPKVPGVEIDVDLSDTELQAMGADDVAGVSFLESLDTSGLYAAPKNKRVKRAEKKKNKKRVAREEAPYEKAPRGAFKNTQGEDVERLPVKDEEGNVVKLPTKEAAAMRPPRAIDSDDSDSDALISDIDDSEYSDIEDEEGEKTEGTATEGEGEETERTEDGDDNSEEEEETEQTEELGSDNISDDSDDEEEDEMDEKEEIPDPMVDPREAERERKRRLEDGDDEDEAARKKVEAQLRAYEREQKHVIEAKQTMASLGSQITMHPHKYIVDIPKIQELVGDKVFIIRKLAMLSLLAIYKDIIPSYRISTVEQKGVVVSRDVKLLRDFEKLLLKSYQAYLQSLDEIMESYTIEEREEKKRQKQIKRKAAALQRKQDQGLLPRGRPFSNKADTPAKKAKYTKEDWETAVRCLCDLLAEVSHFNFTWNIVSMVVPLMNATDSKISAYCCEAIATVFSKDVRGTTTLQTVRLTGEYIKSRNFRVRIAMLETFLRITYLDELKEGEVGMAPQHLSKKQKDKMTKKQQKRWKEMKDVESEMRENEAEHNKAERKRIQTDILRAAFVSYFRVLRKAQTSPLLPAVLKGMGRYTHFINIDFINDIINALRDLIAGDEAANLLTIPVRLQCAISALELLQRGNALVAKVENATVEAKSAGVVSVDMKELYARLYEVLLDVPPYCINDPALLLSMMHCLTLIVRDKKQLNVNRMGAFAKRLATVSLHMPPNASLSILAIIATMLTNYPPIQQLLDNDSKGLGVYMPDLHDPDHCNALSSTLYELAALKGHYHPYMHEYVKEFLQNFALPDPQDMEATNGRAYKPEALFVAYDTSKGGFNPVISQPGQHPLEKLIANNAGKKGKNYYIKVPKSVESNPSPFMTRLQKKNEAFVSRVVSNPQQLYDVIRKEPLN